MTDKLIKINVLFFGACREIVGSGEISFSLPESSSISTALAKLKQDYPNLEKLSDRLLFALNESYATKEQTLNQGDKLAIFPPVSGGEDIEKSDIYELTYKEINSRELALKVIESKDGAVVTFDGITRDNNKGKTVLFLEYEAYETMALKIMKEIAEEARLKWPINKIALVHRLGRVDISQTSVAIIVTSAHRKPAFEACHFLIDRLKQIVPIWKREYFEDGAIWVDPQLQ
ncbi:MAG: molybdenum cofactor biosynthesis protein MoaE [Acidobacteria bacterium]|nr:molybdenum cofactor biosynthesis protein MoaE [Acidobacteriota bacterium]